MKTIKLLFGFMFIGVLATSCYTEVLIEDDVIDIPLNVRQVLQSHDLWYVDINETVGNGEVPFLQRAFTISFENGRMYANNNIVGLGKTGDGVGIQVGFFDTFLGGVDIDHDVDGNWLLQVFKVNNKTIELYDAKSDTSYFLRGYQKHNFDYDMVFYDNIQYFLQEYDAWEKIYVSEEGAINAFDEENFLQFFSGASDAVFKSSIDVIGTNTHDLVWDYEGEYEVFDVANDESLKTLTLDYDFLGDDYFELYVVNDSTIELYHPTSGTVYEFKGRGYIQYLKSGKASGDKKRTKSINKTMNVKRQREK